MPTQTLVVDYTAKDYASLRTAMLDDAARKLPEWTSRSPNDFGVVLIEAFAYVGDVLSYYVDRMANEAYLATATQRSSILNIARMLDYRPDNGRPSTVELTISVVPGGGQVLVPAGSRFSSPSSDPSVAVVVFETDVDLYVDQDADGVVSGAVTATQGQTTRDEVLGTSAGVPSQVFSLQRGPVIEGAVLVFVDEGQGLRPWVFTEHLIDHGSAEMVFTSAADHLGTTSVVFGDGVNGRVPYSGAVVQATYRVGGGSVGNVGARVIDTIVSAPGVVSKVTNLRPAVGGADPESNEQIRHNAPKALSALHRGVTLADYANLALHVSGVAKATAGGLSYTDITVVVAPVETGLPSEALKERVRDYLADKKMVNAHVNIADPVYVPLNITVEVEVLPTFAQSSVRTEALNTITRLVSFDHVDFGQTITVSDIYRALAKVSGISRALVTTLARSTDSGGGTDDVVLGAFEIPSPTGGVISINATGGISSVSGVGGGGGGGTLTTIPGEPGAPVVDSLSCPVGAGYPGAYDLQIHWDAADDASSYGVILDFYAGAEYRGSQGGGSYTGTSARVEQGFPGDADVLIVHVRANNGPNSTDGPGTTVAYPCGLNP